MINGVFVRPIEKSIAVHSARVARRMPRWMDKRDFEQDAAVAVLEILPKTKLIPGYLGYIERRIRGGIVDGLRRMYGRHLEARDMFVPIDDVDLRQYGANYDFDSVLISEDARRIIENSELNRKEKLVIALVYFENKSHVEVSKILDLNPSRISQIHTKAIMKLRISNGIVNRSNAIKMKIQ